MIFKCYYKFTEDKRIYLLIQRQDDVIKAIVTDWFVASNWIKFDISLCPEITAYSSGHTIQRKIAKIYLKGSSDKNSCFSAELNDFEMIDFEQQLEVAFREFWEHCLKKTWKM